jgi:YceI-like domain
MKALFASVLLVSTSTLAHADSGTWRIVQGEVRVTCPMTVGGSFEATTRSMGGTLTAQAKPQPFAGAIEVDLATLDSGIALRDEHMRDTYLEVGRGEGYGKAVLAEIRLGDVDPRTFEGPTSFTGVLLLHGTRHPISGAARVRRDGSGARVEATFSVKVSDYAIPKPQYLGVGVKNEVQLKVSFLVAPGGGAK